MTGLVTSCWRILWKTSKNNSKKKTFFGYKFFKQKKNVGLTEKYSSSSSQQVYDRSPCSELPRGTPSCHHQLGELLELCRVRGIRSRGSSSSASSSSTSFISSVAGGDRRREGSLVFLCVCVQTWQQLRFQHSTHVAPCSWHAAQLVVVTFRWPLCEPAGWRERNLRHSLGGVSSVVVVGAHSSNVNDLLVFCFNFCACTATKGVWRRETSLILRNSIP